MIIERAIQYWAISGVALLICGIAIRKRIPANWRFSRSAILGFSLAWLFSPTIAVGTIVLPVPAGTIIIMVGSDMLRSISQVQGPNLGNMPAACSMFVIGIVFFSALTYWLSKPKNENHRANFERSDSP